MTTPIEIKAGFLPLLDSALLIVAREKGFAAAHGLELQLVRENSWANIRDRIAVGHFDVAHMLAPMVVANTLGLSPLPIPMIAPIALGLGGNAVTVSRKLWARMRDAGAPSDLSALATGKALKSVVDAGPRRIRLGVVHPYSGHNYELRYWLAASGIQPDSDVEIVVLPPALMPEALQVETIDGYCVGEPWNSVGAAMGARIATVKAAIWRSSPEKVLGVTEGWALRNPGPLSSLIRALYQAAQWTQLAENHEEAARILSRPGYLAVPQRLVLQGLSGQLDVDGETCSVADFFVPFDRAATFPWQSHALWFYSQMVRWGQLENTPDNSARAAASFRPDIYRTAVAPLGAPVPGANAKVEGALREPTPVGVSRGSLSLGPDGFFDGRLFDPQRLDAYLEAQRRQPD